MPLYLARFGYTPEAWAALVKKPQDRREAVRPLVEAAGCTLHGFWYAFGEQDGYLLFEGPDNASAASIAIAAAAGGAVRSLETTVLMTVEETLEALRKAQTLPYRPPSGSS